MTKEEQIQQKKNEALNRIRKMFHPFAKREYDHYSFDSMHEQQGYEVNSIIERLEKDLKEIQNKFGKTEKTI